MIRRDAGNDWLLIAQAHHAHLAGELARQWGNRNVPGLPLSNELTRAVHDHDEGWYQWEQRPQVDPETGRPRDFTEMPMAVAAAIWSRSIETAGRGVPRQSEALGRYQRYLSKSGERLTGERAAVLEAVLGMGATFVLEELLDALAEDVSRAGLLRAVTELELAGVIDARESPVGGRYFEVVVPAVGPSPLAALWVSRHFTYLAEQARESRREEPQELAALERFLKEQSDRRRQWSESIRDFAGDELKRVIETGYRYVQFFDRISLWLCAAEPTGPTRISLPGNGVFQLSPKARKVMIEPYPLAAGELTLRVPCRRIAARRYTDQADLLAALAAAPLEELTWTVTFPTTD